MSNLAALMAEAGMNLPVTAWVDEWRKAGKHITDEAVDKVLAVMAADLKSGRRSDGSKRFRPSMIGNPCPRAQVFSYYGAKQEPRVEAWDEMADAGSWLHYKWQLEGLSAGWLTDIEVQIDLPNWYLRGSVDGRNADGSVLEIKTVGTDRWKGFRGDKAIADWTEPKYEHIRQAHPYMLATGADAVSLVYVNRDSNAFREFRVALNGDIMHEMSLMVTDMIRHVDKGTLPEILPGCWRVFDGDILEDCTKQEVAKWTKQVNYCNFSTVCQEAEMKRRGKA